jgi:hypothetical protein
VWIFLCNLIDMFLMQIFHKSQLTKLWVSPTETALMDLLKRGKQASSINCLPAMPVKSFDRNTSQMTRHIFGPVTHFSLCKTGGNHEASRSSQHCEVGRSYWWPWKWSFPHGYEILLHVFFLSKAVLIVWTFKLALFRWSQISWLPFYSLLESSFL